MKRIMVAMVVVLSLVSLTSVVGCGSSSSKAPDTKK
jgi:hypothetical protein